MVRRMFRNSLIGGALAVLVASQAAAQDSLQDYVWTTKVSTAFDYSSGKYGAATPTKIAFAPVTLQSTRGPWTLKGSTSWMSLDGPALIFDGAGEGTAGVDRKVNGMGDINLSATYALEQFYDRGVYIDLTARLKLPTASFRKGLGTGEGDLATQVDFSTALGDFLPFMTAGYKFNGSPETLALRDVPYGSVGLQYVWNPDLAVGVAYDYRQSAIKSQADPQEGSVYLSVKLDERWAMNVYGVAGFSDNSPSAGAGVVFTYRPNLGQIPRPN